MKIVNHIYLICLVALLGTSCGSSDEAYLALKVNSPPDQVDDIRRFPPYMPSPLNVRVEIFKSTDLREKPNTPTHDLEQAWEELEADPISSNKYMLITIPANEDKDYTYLLRLSSIVQEGPGLIVDECAAIGQIVAAKGAKVRLDITTHLGACKLLVCQKDQDCVGEDRYCLSFECQDRTPCPAEECPDGAYCSGFGVCAGSCEIDSECEDGFSCCQGMCSAHCPN